MGQLAGLLTAFLWVLTANFFTAAGKTVGSVVVNRVRLLLAVVFIVIMHTLIEGHPLPLNAEPERWFWLGLSGIIGLVIGDALLFQAFVQIGPRLSLLMMSSVPVISTLLAWLFLGETLAFWSIVAIGVTVSGIAWVVLEQRDPTQHADARNYLIGILFGLGGAVGQATGLVTAKQGLVGDFSSLTALEIRMVVATVVMWSITIFRGQAMPTIRAMSNRRARNMIVLGSFVGPFLGVWFSLIAVDLAPIGIASTLMATTPIWMLPVSRWYYKEKISHRAVVGTVIAVVGVAMIFLVG